MNEGPSRRSGSADSDISRGQLVVLIVPGLFSIITVVFAVAGLWWVAVLAGVAGVGAGICPRRQWANEQADEALAITAEEEAGQADQLTLQPGADR